MKKDKLKTADFTNKEFNFSWPSQKIRDFGYWFDQTNYCLKRYARDGEMVISEREYEKLKNSKEEKESVCNKEYEKVIAEQKRQIEELKKQRSGYSGLWYHPSERILLCSIDRCGNDRLYR